MTTNSENEMTWGERFRNATNFVTKDYVLMVLINCLYTFSMVIALAHLTLHATASMDQSGLGMTMTTFGVIATVNSIIVFLSRPVAGALSSKGYLKNLQVGALVLLAASFILLGFSPNSTVLVIGQILRGIAFGAAGTILPVMVRNSVPENQYQQALGFYFMVPMVAIVPAPALAVKLFNIKGYGLPTSVGAGMLILAAVLTLFVTNHQRECTSDRVAGAASEDASDDSAEHVDTVATVPASKSEKRIIPPIAVKVLPYAIANIFVGMCYTAIMTNLLVFDKQINLGIYSVWMTTYSAVSIFSSALTGLVSSKIGNRPTIMICISFIAAAMGIFAFAESWPLYIMAAVFYAIGQNGFVTPMIAASVELVPSELAATATSTMYMGADLGGIISGALIGVLVDKLGFHNMYAVAMVCAIIALLFVAFTTGRTGGAKQRSAKA